MLRGAGRGIGQHKDSEDWDPRFAAGACTGVPHTAAAAGRCLGNGAALCIYIEAALLASQAQPATGAGICSGCSWLPVWLLLWQLSCETRHVLIRPTSLQDAFPHLKEDGALDITIIKTTGDKVCGFIACSLHLARRQHVRPAKSIFQMMGSHASPATMHFLSGV